MLRSLDWETDGRDWPNREASRFVDAAGVRWHVQCFGAGPAMLLIHGTGGATHSWRDLAPRLGEHFRVIAVDLPGHGFSSPAPPRELTLPAVSASLSQLVQRLEEQPSVCVGHSAGAAIAIQMTLEGLARPELLVSLNGALLPLSGLAGWIFSPVAGLIASNTALPRLFAWRAQERRVAEQLIGNTGSTIDERGFSCYWRLAQTPSHVSAALGLMASWDLASLKRRLPELKVPLQLIVGGKDRMVPPEDGNRVREMVPDARLVVQPELGHLAHEERPEETAELILTEIRALNRGAA